MDLAKPCLDVGLYTDRDDDLRAFYVDRLGLPYEELLKAGRGVHQHRVGLHGSVLKLNSSREPLDDAPTAFVRLDIHADRYLTVQVRDVRAEHARLLELGWTEGTAPVKLGETAFISFVLDPDGAPVEISQRASLTGPLPSV